MSPKNKLTVMIGHTTAGRKYVFAKKHVNTENDAIALARKALHTNGTREIIISPPRAR